MTDDQDARSLYQMPATQRTLVQNGTRFTRAFATTSQCCPSRASMLRGQYAHNHGVKDNTPPNGSFSRWDELELDKDNLATRLKDSGYITAYGGKYMNEYFKAAGSVEPGWTRWWAYTRGMANPNGWYVNENGNEVWVDRDVYSDPDYLKMRGEAFVRNRAGGAQPWMLTLAPFVPHHPYFHAPRHAPLYEAAEAPRTPDFNEPDVSDKPAAISKRALYDEAGVAKLDEGYQDRLRGLRGVDEMVDGVMRALEQTGQLQNTYIMFVSDNGYMMGHHRIEGKVYPYEASIKIPMVIRGPGVPKGAVRPQLVGNLDVGPTIAGWTGVDLPYADGRSLSPLLSETPPAAWRKRILIEYFSTNAFDAVRTSDEKMYAEYGNGDREFYDLKQDPYELENAYPNMDPALQQTLTTKLDALKNCAKETCRAAEDAP